MTNEALQKAQKAMQRALKKYGANSPQFQAAQRKWVALKERA
jgi:hypothetical protein